MGYRDKAQESATEAQNNTGGSGGDYDGIDLTGDEIWVRVHPGTFFTGVFPEDEGNPVIKFPAYDDDAQEVNAGGYLGLVMDDPQLIVDEDEGTEGTVILETNDDDSSDYRIYNPDVKGAEVIDGVGVEFDSGQGARIYKGDLVDEFPDQRVVLVVSGNGSQNIAKRLDVKGVNALYDYDEGQPNGGLIEYPLRDDEGNRVDVDGNPVEFQSRYARRPELKDSLYGTRIGLLMDWSSNMVNVDELDEDAREAFESRDGDSYYYSLFNIDAEEEITIDEDGEPDQYSYLEWRYDPDGADRIPEDQFEFVTGYVDEADDFSEDAIREAIQSNADEFDSEPEEDRIVEMIQERA